MTLAQQTMCVSMAHVVELLSVAHFKHVKWWYVSCPSAHSVIHHRWFDQSPMFPQVCDGNNGCVKEIAAAGTVVCATPNNLCAPPILCDGVAATCAPSFTVEPQVLIEDVVIVANVEAPPHATAFVPTTAEVVFDIVGVTASCGQVQARFALLTSTACSATSIDTSVDAHGWSEWTNVSLSGMPVALQPVMSTPLLSLPEAQSARLVKSTLQLNQLETYTVIAEVRAYLDQDEVSAMSARACSQPFRIDTTPPIAGNVLLLNPDNELEVISGYQHSPSFSVVVSDFSDDSDTTGSMLTYELKVCVLPCTDNNHTLLDYETIELSSVVRTQSEDRALPLFVELQNEQQHRVIIRAANQAMLTVEAYFDVWVDLTAPIAGAVNASTVVSHPSADAEFSVMYHVTWEEFVEPSGGMHTVVWITL